MNISPVLTSEEAGSCAEALWRALNYLCVIQLYLRDNVLLQEPLQPEHIKIEPRGHWGTCPGVNWILAHLQVMRATCSDIDLEPVIGPGHAGICQLAFAWLNGSLTNANPELLRNVQGLTRLVQLFPDLPGVGAEVSPLLWGGTYVGGQLGQALAFACGAALDSPSKVFVPIVGDGECETGTTAAAWLGSRTLELHKAAHGGVLPIIWLNGQRMGGPSLLSRLDDDQIRAYLRGLSWNAVTVSVRGALTEHVAFHELLCRELTRAVEGQRDAVVLAMPKGWTAPARLGESMHKAPLHNPQQVAAERAALASWLTGYRPDELFRSDGSPNGYLAAALNTMPQQPRRGAATHCLQPSMAKVALANFGEAVSHVLSHHANVGDMRVFSPDELASNHLSDVAQKPWAHELLDEQVCLAWLLGYISTGRRAILISYEAFASLLVTPLIQHLKQSRIQGRSELRTPSLNLLLTSLGWHNTYTHGDPSLITALLGTQDAAVHVICPGDPGRLSLSLDRALRSHGRLNVFLASKHTLDPLPEVTISEELNRGIGIWQSASDSGPLDLVLASCGDLPARQLLVAARRLRTAFGIRIRHVHIHDLTVLGDPAIWPDGLETDEIEEYFGAHTPLLIATLGHTAAIWGLLAARLSNRPVAVVGWREPAAPMAVRLLLENAGMSADRLAATAAQLWRSAPRYRERALA